MPKKDKNVVVISDLHCGHRVGLTPPEWQQCGKYGKIQSEIWGFYTDQIDALKPIDILIVNGDMIDGKQSRSKSTEAVSADMYEQAKMAAYCINYAEPKTIVATYGTPYHVGDGEDWEAVALSHCDTKKRSIEGHAFPNVNSVQFDVKHKVGSSTIPHGRFTAIAKEKLWNTIWHNRWEQQPDAGIMIRSHVHYCVYCGDPYFYATTTPALQGYGSKFGTRQCSGTVDIGLLQFTVTKNGTWSHRRICAQLPHQKVQPLYL